MPTHPVRHPPSPPCGRCNSRSRTLTRPVHGEGPRRGGRAVGFQAAREIELTLTLEGRGPQEALTQELPLSGLGRLRPWTGLGPAASGSIIGTAAAAAFAAWRGSGAGAGCVHQPGGLAGSTKVAVPA
eukprot:scaffold3311_cov411-Prasinococcus_capsulatus_cf.AAC.6